jgi:hypothetical protein
MTYGLIIRVRPIRRENMKKMEAILLLGVFAFSLNADTLNTLGPSIYSVQLKTNGLFAISSLLPGTMMSVKKMINSNKGYRISVGVSAGVLNSQQGANGELTRDYTIDSFSISLHASYLTYPYRDGNLYLYVGAGPFGRYSYNRVKDISQSKETNNYTIGMDFFPGIEWFIIKHLSLLLEYDVDCYYQYSRTKTDIPGSNFQIDPDRVRSFNLEYSTVFIGFSIYL